MKTLILILILALSGQLYATNNSLGSFQNFAIKKLKAVSDSRKDVWQNWAEDNVLYQEIITELKNKYEKIGKEQADRLINSNLDISIGQYNNIGFTWKKPFSQFSINVRRQVTPYLFDERWLVKDEFEIVIEATKLISNLKDLGVLDINEKQYAAFAGVTFSRVYRYSHFANSYLEGLTKRFDHLFFAFTKFRPEALLTLDPYDVLEKEDYLSAQAGGVINVPLYNVGYARITAQGGALVRFSRLSHIWAQALASDEVVDPTEKIRISSEKSKSVEVGVSAGVQADFLNLLRLTLLSYDFTYKYDEAYKTNLSFRMQDLIYMDASNPIGDEILTVLRGGKGDVSLLAPFIVSEETRINQMKKSRFILFLLGNTKTSNTERTQVVKNGIIRTYFEHNFEKMRFVQNPISRLLAAILNSIFKINPQIANLTSETKKVHIEYEDERDLLKAKDVLDVRLKEKLSLAFDTDIYSYKTTGWFHKNFRKFASRKLASYRSLDNVISQKVLKEELVGPMEIHQKILLDQNGIANFHNMMKNKFLEIVERICDESEYESEGCVAELSGHFDLYNKGKKMGMIPVVKLKKFMLSFSAITDKKNDFDKLFGEKNVFLYGEFSARTKSGVNFLTNFREGVFTDLGVVDSQEYIGNGRAVASSP